MLEWDNISFYYVGELHSGTDLYVHDICEHSGDISIVGSISSVYTTDGSSSYSLFRYDLAENILELIVEGTEFTTKITTLANSNDYYPQIIYQGIVKVWLTSFYGTYHLHFNFKLKKDNIAPSVYSYSLIDGSATSSVTYSIDSVGEVTEVYNALDQNIAVYNYLLTVGGLNAVSLSFQRYSFINQDSYPIKGFFNLCLNYTTLNQKYGSAAVLPDIPGAPHLLSQIKILSTNFNNAEILLTDTSYTLIESDLDSATFGDHPVESWLVLEELPILVQHSSLSATDYGRQEPLVYSAPEKYILKVALDTSYEWVVTYPYRGTRSFTEELSLLNMSSESSYPVEYSHNSTTDSAEFQERWDAIFRIIDEGLVKYDTNYFYIEDRKLAQERIFTYKPWTLYNYSIYNIPLGDSALLDNTSLEDTYPTYSWGYYGGVNPQGSYRDITFVYTNYDDYVWGILTLMDGDTNLITEIEKNSLVFGAERGVQTTSGLYVLSSHYIYFLEYVPDYKIKPTSITIDYDTIHIGGQSIMDYSTVSGIYLGSGIPTYRNPMYVNVLIPEITTVSGDYSSVVLPTYKRIGYSGLAYVKKYNSYESFVYGSINPFRATLVGRSSFFDMSYDLPSGIASTSVALGTLDYLTASTGTIYSLSISGESWDVFASLDPIVTSHLSFLNEFFIANTGGAYSVQKTSSIYMPIWEKADYNLPAGAIVLDLEEDFYDDR